MNGRRNWEVCVKRASLLCWWYAKGSPYMSELEAVVRSWLLCYSFNKL